MNSTTRPRDYAEMDDDALVRATREDDLAAFEEIVRRYREPMTRLAYRFVRNLDDARDLSQEGFIRAYTQLVRYQDGTHFDRWLAKVVANTCRDFLRKRRRTATEDLDRHAEKLASSSPTPAEAAEANELERRFQRELEALPFGWRIVFVLHEQEGMKHADIAEILEEEESTIRWRLFKARERLRERLADLIE